MVPQARATQAVTGITGKLDNFSIYLRGTGLLYGWLKYFHQRPGDFGPEPFPLQGLTQHAHVLAGPFLVFSLGMMVRGHLLPALRSGKARGGASGWAWRTALAWVHGPAALLFLVAYGIHVLRYR